MNKSTITKDGKEFVHVGRSYDLWETYKHEGVDEDGNEIVEIMQVRIQSYKGGKVNRRAGVDSWNDFNGNSEEEL